MNFDFATSSKACGDIERLICLVLYTTIVSIAELRQCASSPLESAKLAVGVPLPLSWPTQMLNKIFGKKINDKHVLEIPQNTYICFPLNFFLESAAVVPSFLYLRSFRFG